MHKAPDSLRGEHRSQCTACGEMFNRTSLFDKHRAGPYSERRCLTPDEMTAKGWRKTDSGYWVGPARIMAESGWCPNGHDDGVTDCSEKEIGGAE